MHLKTPKELLSIFVIVFLLSASACMAENEIIWPKSAKYKKAVEVFKISESDAYKILRSKIKDDMDPYFSNVPLCIIGGKYLFARKDKTRLRLEGYYFDGMTGEIEYKSSDVSIKPGTKKLPLNAYTNSKKIN